MWALVLDTSSDQGIAGLFADGKKLFDVALPTGYRHSTYLVGQVREGLRSVGITPHDLSYIAVGTGPGSYTGLRVAASIAKTLSYAAGVPLVSVCSLLAWAPAEAILIDARVSGVYGWRGGAPCVVAIAELPQWLEGVSTVVSPHPSLIQKRVALSSAYTWLERAPALEALASAAEEEFRQGKATRGDHLPLIYLSQTQTERHLPVLHC